GNGDGVGVGVALADAGTVVDGVTVIVGVILIVGDGVGVFSKLSVEACSNRGYILSILSWLRNTSPS
ncbi:MAG TPA: hypothetical protein ENK70_02445, partial [Methylophaga sp.]|nr:hypothetical protein [Methylophaga sp.]